MKNNFYLLTFVILPILLLLLLFAGRALKQEDNGYSISREKDVKVEEPGPHNGGGKTTAFAFFNKVKGVKVVFRKRILHPGSSIGYHLQNEQEIYYIVSGNGELQMNGKIIAVTAGDAILTFTGSSHGLKPTGNEDLTLLISYQN